MNKHLIKLKNWNYNRKEFFRKTRNKVLLGVYYYLYKRKGKTIPTDLTVNCDNVIILAMGYGIGDSIVMSGLIAALRANNKKVYIVCYPKLAKLYSSMIETDGVYLLENGDNTKLKDVQKKEWVADLIVDFLDPDKNLYKRVRALIGIKHKIAVGFNQENNKFFDINIVREEQGTHWSDRLKTLLKLLSIKSGQYKYNLKFSSQCMRNVENFINSLNEREIIIFNPTASDKIRSLSITVIDSTINYFLQNSNKTLVVYNVYDTELINKYPDVTFNPFSDLEECVYLISKCSFVLTTDTSFVHAANFFNVQMVAIYNNRLANKKYWNNDLWGPNYKKARQIFSKDYVNTESGDNLQNLPFEIIEQALKDYEL